MEALLVLFLFFCMTVFLNRKAEQFEAMEKRAREEGRLPPDQRLKNVKAK